MRVIIEQDFKKIPDPKYAIIYFDEYETCSQIVRPTAAFDGGWSGLIDNITGSDARTGLKRYSHYKIY